MTKGTDDKRRRLNEDTDRQIEEKRRRELEREKRKQDAKKLLATRDLNAAGLKKTSGAGAGKSPLSSDSFGVLSSAPSNPNQILNPLSK